VTENLLPGTTDTWDVVNAGAPSIQGFATDISVNTGQTANFKIKTDSANYKIDIYRLGTTAAPAAQGGGARNIQSRRIRRRRASDAATDWSTAHLGGQRVMEHHGAVSGIYVAKLTRFDGRRRRHIVSSP
jgi:hypothetical protein